MKKLLSKKYTTNACALTAVCYASRKDEETLFRLCEAHNLNFNDGLTDTEWMKIVRILGIKIRHVLKEPMLLGQFMKKHPKGLYFVGEIDHLFVVDNGVLFDPRTPDKKLPGLRRTIVQAWKATVPDSVLIHPST